MTTEDGRPPEPSDEQKRSGVWRHPRRDDILALLPVRSSDWIAAWLEEQYPLEDDEGEPDPAARQHQRWRLSTRSIESYRRRFAPEAVAGVDLVPAELEDLIGRQAPAPEASRREIQQLEVLAHAAMTNLGRAMGQDAEMDMLQPVTMEAQKQAIGAVNAVIDAKTKMGVDGYQPRPQEVHVDQRNLNVEVNGDGHLGRQVRRDGKAPSRASDPEKIQALHRVLERGPDEAREVIDAARDEVIEGQATEA